MFQRVRSVVRGAGRRYRSVVGEDLVVRSPYSDVEVQEKTVPERVFEFTGRWPEKTAVVCGASGRQVTYAQLERRARTLAASLRTRLALQDGDRVAVLLPNCPEYPVVTLGSLLAGASVALVNPAYKSAELLHHFAVARPKLIITTLQSYPTVREALEKMKMNTPVMITDPDSTPENTIKYTEFSETDIDLSVLKSVKVTPNDMAILPFSSGTTGLPKGVDLPHKTLVASSYICSHPEYIVQQPAIGEYQDVVPAVLPFYHIYGHVSVMLNCLVHGSRLVTLPQFTPELFLKMLAQHKSTLMFAVPPIVQFLTKHPLVKPEYLETTRQLVCGGACLPPVEVEAFETKAKSTELLQAYGLTETSALGSGNAKGKRAERQINSCGTVFANVTMKVTDMESQNNLGPNKEGELWVRGLPVMRGYYQNPEQTKAVLSEDGWLRTGDVGYYDEKGHFYVTERLKELIKVKGFQVAPAELEGVLLAHPAVTDAGVVGAPKGDSTEEPVAFVVLKEGSGACAEELIAHVSERVTAYKRLGAVKFVQSIPKTNTGKILRRELKTML